MKNLLTLEREINSLDTGRMSIQVEGTFLEDEITSLLGKGALSDKRKNRDSF